MLVPGARASLDRTSHIAAAAFLVSREYPRCGHGVAATRPRRRRDSSATCTRRQSTAGIGSRARRYERVCIEQWLASGKTTSPMTGEVLAYTHLVPNHNAKSTVGAFLDEARELGRAVDSD